MKITPTRSTRAPRNPFANLRATLLRRREELLHHIHGELASSRPDYLSTRLGDDADRASAAFYDELAQGFAEIASADLHCIERAIHRIDRGLYGRCEACGRPIPRLRLRALPFADLCVECKREEETVAARLAHKASPADFGEN